MREARKKDLEEGPNYVGLGDLEREKNFEEGQDYVELDYF